MLLTWSLLLSTPRVDDAGTDANVSCNLLYQPINDGDRSKLHTGASFDLSGSFEQNSDAYNTLKDDCPDGFELCGIELWHDNTGNKPGWMVAVINITPLGTIPVDGIYSFTLTPSNAWIAADEPGSSVWRNPAEGNKIDYVSRRFWFKDGPTIVADNSRLTHKGDTIGTVGG